RTLRRRKRAFLVPLRAWLDGPLHDMVTDTLTASSVRARELFRPPAIARLLDEQRARRHDHSRALWTLLTLHLWLEHVLDAPAPAHD
ncbi:MAG TPA: asparagine synthase-related protein, partial [Dongiaceae bacterium]|nr:asparagine synthase-related protein [Dongiaceae bacterium]